MIKNGMRPLHPGEILREDYMLPLGLSATALAHAMGVTPARINDIVRERRGITADTALRLARYFGTDAQSWINLQTATERGGGPNIHPLLCLYFTKVCF
jgi:addiction module HigA family antidote